MRASGIKNASYLAACATENQRAKKRDNISISRKVDTQTHTTHIYTVLAILCARFNFFFLFFFYFLSESKWLRRVRWTYPFFGFTLRQHSSQFQISETVYGTSEKSGNGNLHFIARCSSALALLLLYFYLHFSPHSEHFSRRKALPTM